MGLEHTSVPRWPPARPRVDPAARALAVLAFTADGVAVLSAWREETPPDLPLWVHAADRADEATLDLLAGQIAAASVGWRLLVAGPEADVLAARARAIGLGVLDAEIGTAVTDSRRKRVFCPHCQAVTETTQPVSAEVACAGCRRRLHVYGHVARRTGTYLGFMADAEDVA